MYLYRRHYCVKNMLVPSCNNFNPGQGNELKNGISYAPGRNERLLNEMVSIVLGKRNRLLGLQRLRCLLVEVMKSRT